MYNKPSEKVEKRRGRVGAGDATKGIAQIGAGISATMGGENSQRVPMAIPDEKEEPQLTVWVALFTLAVSTALVALCAEAMVRPFHFVSFLRHSCPAEHNGQDN